MRALPFLVVAALAASPAAAPASAPASVPRSNATTTRPGSSEVRYSVLMAGRVAGSQVVTTDGPDVHVTFQYADRGRGPELDSRLRLSPDGTTVSVATSGHDYMKSPVAERFTLAGGEASWSSRGERGRQAVAGPVEYVSFDAAPAELGLVAMALARHGGELELLPAGHARLERVGEVTCRVDGRAHVLAEHVITGLDFVPTPVWLDERGGYFGQVSSWMSVVPRGFESCAPELLAAQDAASARWYAALARMVTRTPPALVIEHARVFDADRASLRPDTTVVVEKGRITAVGAGAARPAGAEVIDAAGKVLLPGLWDMHVHVSEADGPLHVAAGVTTVRDMANDVDTLARLRDAWAAGSQLGPRVIPAGVVDGRGPYAGPTKMLVSTAEEARAVVDRYVELGYPQLKIYSSVDPKLVPGLVSYAHARGMRVSGHVPAFMTATQAVQAGFDELQHINLLLLGFWFDTVKDTRGPVRFSALGEKAALLDLGSKQVTDLVALLRERHVVVDPTLAVFEDMLTARPGHVSPTYAAVADRVPVTVRRGFLGGGAPVTAADDQRYRDSFRMLLRVVKLLYDRGITLVAGTDALAGLTLDRELELYVESGIPAPEVLRMATLDAARVMHQDGELGSVEPGKIADLVLFDGNPVERISDVRRPALVVLGGRVVDPVALGERIGLRR